MTAHLIITEPNNPAPIYRRELDRTIASDNAHVAFIRDVAVSDGRKLHLWSSNVGRKG